MSKAMSKIHKFNSEQLAESVLKLRKKEKTELPAFVAREFEVDKILENKRMCYRLIPKEGFDGTYIFYIYGGQMCKAMDELQWQFITALAHDIGAGVFIPMYPLAPESTCEELFEMLVKAYANFRMSIDVKKTILLGDSSGAGLALSLALLAWNEGLRKPEQLILLSPILDTEFFDKELEKKLIQKSKGEKDIFYNESAKEFINDYWVKGYAVKTQYTSPFYEDYTDICDDVVLFSSRDEMFADYHKAFYNKAKQQGLNVRFYEFENEKHDFMIYSNTRECKRAYSYLVDVINGTYDTALHHLYMVKRMTDWRKKYPELIQSDAATKFLYDKKFDFSSVATRLSEYQNLLLMSNFCACDEKVRRFIKEFPYCTVVQVGCLLDDMFSRLDNGRIQWYSVGSHNNMSVRRALYGVRDREITIGRNIMDFSWIDDINCPRNKGIIFVCNDIMARMNTKQVRALFEKLNERFSGAEFLFTSTTKGAKIWLNLTGRTLINTKKRRFAVDDADSLFGEWSPEYKIISEEPVTNFIPDKKGLKLFTRLRIKYNQITFNYKLVHLKLGGEVYEIKL